MVALRARTAHPKPRLLARVAALVASLAFLAWPARHAAVAEEVEPVETPGVSVRANIDPMQLPPYASAWARTYTAGPRVYQEQGRTADGSLSLAIAHGIMSFAAEAQSWPGETPDGHTPMATLQVSYFDRMTILPSDPALIGQRGRFTATYEVTGAGDATAPAEWAGLSHAYARASYEFGASFDPSLGTFALAAAGTWDSVAGGEAQFTGTPFGVLSVVVDFIFGEPIEHRAAASGSAAEGLGLSVPPGDALLRIDSIRWLGIDEVFGPDGRPIAGFSVTSESGTDWSSPAAVPEPGALLAPALAAAALLSRRRRARPLR